MKIAIAIVIAVALLSAAIIATHFSTDRMTGLVACDDPMRGDLLRQIAFEKAKDLTP